MESQLRTDDLAVTLVEQALQQPLDEREQFLQNACSSDLELFQKALSYLRWEHRMQSFLKEPVALPDEPASPFHPGQRLLGRFEIVREVARGGMGIVWEARDRKLNERVAIKCAKTGFGKQLPPEVQHAREVSHPNVCKIHEIHTARIARGEIDFVSMEFLDGGTLRERLADGKLTDKEAKTIALQLCAGLAEAHRNHVIHGDLKTNNVILTKDDDGSLRAVITDFGLARRSEGDAPALGGTKAYMAPELWNNAAPSVASDIYALGVMLWEIHTGRAPADLGMGSDTLAMGERGVWIPPKGRGKWDRIVARCIAPEPVRRFQGATQVARAFGPSQIVKWAVGLAAAAALVTGVAVLLHWWWSPSKESIRMAFLPANSPHSILARETDRQLAQLKGTERTNYRFLTFQNRVDSPEHAARLGATHLLRSKIDKVGSDFVVRAHLTDLRSGVELPEWSGRYKASDLKFAPVALAALATEALHIPPPLGGASVNSAAQDFYKKALLAMRHGMNATEAMQLAQQANAADHDAASTWAALAEAQFLKYAEKREKNWLVLATESVRQAEIRNSDLPAVHRAAGSLMMQNGRYSEAIHAFLRSIEHEPENGDAFRRLGSAYDLTEEKDKAELALREAIKLDPFESRNYGTLADLYSGIGRYEEAIVNLKRALRLAPRSPRLHSHLAIAYLNSGDFRQAENEIRQSIALAEVPNSLITLGVVLMYQSRDREAIPFFLRAVGLGPVGDILLMNLGTAYRRSGQTRQAMKAFQHSFELAESELANDSHRALSRSFLAYSAANQGDVHRAEAEIAQALQERPAEAEIRFLAAATFEVLRRRESTLEVLRDASKSVLKDLSRWPDVADLGRDPRFIKLLARQER